MKVDGEEDPNAEPNLENFKFADGYAVECTAPFSHLKLPVNPGANRLGLRKKSLVSYSESQPANEFFRDRMSSPNLEKTLTHLTRVLPNRGKATWVLTCGTLKE